MFDTLINKMVIVRSSQSGVHFGELVKAEVSGGNGTAEVLLKDARRIWSWVGAGSCTGLAVHGPTGGKITPPASEVAVMGCCEVLLATPQAVEAIGQIPAWSGR